MTKSWKTTVAGILALALLAAHAMFPTVLTVELTTAITTILVALGLAVAKDGDKTGV